MQDARGVYAAGLTESVNGKEGFEAVPGLVAFNLESGERSDVRGGSHNLVSDGAAVDPATVEGAFDGAFHVCDACPQSAIATFAGHAGQHGAKPSLGKDKTQFAITFKSGDGWSRAVEATLPFDRNPIRTWCAAKARAASRGCTRPATAWRSGGSIAWPKAARRIR